MKPADHPDVAGDSLEFSAVRLRRRGAILNAVARVTEHAFAVGSWRTMVPEALATLGRATGVSRVYVFERQANGGDHARVSQRFEWVADGIQPQIDNPDLQDLDLEASGFARWVELLRAGSSVVGDIDEFPPSERPLLEAQSIRSILVQPIFAGAFWWGFIGFDACEREQAWEEVEVDALRIAARVLGASALMEQREEQFRQAHKMEALGRMAGGVAHDFNNMLAVVFASVDLLKRAIAADKAEMVSRHIGVVQQAATQAARLTRQLLDFSRRRESAGEITAPLDVIESMAELLQQVAGRRVRVEIDALGVIEPARIERAQLEQVVLNLVGNAGDAMPDGGALQIRLRSVDRDESRAYGDEVPDGRWTLLSVRDSGHGIPAEIRDRVFEPFFTTKDVGHGTGLGLATVYGAVSSAGGHIRLTSERGQGTEMRVYLPTVAQRAAVSAPEADGVTIATRAARRGRGERVIVCDDSAAIRSWITQVLSDDGYDAIAAASGDECLSLAHGNAVDLLVTDVRMPEMDGPTLRRRMRETMPELPTVFMSGFAADLLEREGIDPRSEAFLDKPFSREQLIDAVTIVLAKARALRGVGGEG